MKKSILLFGAFLLSVSMAFSQAPIYTETFGAGIPAGWTNGGVDANGVSHTGMWKYTKTGSHGTYSGGATLNSPTAADGWIIFDSDSLDTRGTGNPGTGPAPAGQRGYLTSTAYNFTGHNHVLLQFYQELFNYNTNTRVVVDNGTNSDTIEVNSDLQYIFAISKNPSFKQYDISAIAAGQSAVKITFLWDLTRDGFYFWQVDDVTMLDAPANDLLITQSGSFDFNIYPLSEVDSFGYYARVTNIGSVVQPNTKVSLTVKKGTTVVFTDTSAAGLTLPLGIDSPIIGLNSYAPPAIPASIGTYTSIVRVFSDSVAQLPYRTADTTHFAVSDSVFAVDNGVYGGSIISFLPAQYATSGQSAAREWATIYYLPNQDTVTSISAAFDNLQTSVGAIVQANVYALPADYPAGSTNTFAVTPVVQTESKTLTTAYLPTSNTTYGQINRPVNLQVNNVSGNPVLPPGFYAVSIVVTNDSLASLDLGTSGSGAYGLPGGLIDGGSLTAYSDVYFYLRMNLGHGFQTLWCNFTRTPAGAYVRPGQAVTFTGQSNGGASTAVYSWDITGTSGYPYSSQVGKIVKDTFQFADTLNVCLTVTDGGSSVQTCKQLVVKNVNVGINEVSPLSDVSMIPNPTTGKVTISAEDITGTTTISITNMIGEEVKHFTETANGSLNKTINIADLSSGLYIVRIQNGGNTVSNRLSLTK